MKKLLIIVLCIFAFAGIIHAQEVGPDSYPPGVNPLTGLTVDHPENLDRRPLLIKIDNYPPEVRPQSDVMEADMVWEYLLTGVIYASRVFTRVDANEIDAYR